MAARMSRIALFFISAMPFLAGCSHQAVLPASVASVPPPSVVDPVPGRFAYRLETASLARLHTENARKGFVCGTDKIALNAEASLRGAIDQTLPLLFERVQPASGQPSAETLRREGLDGLVTISVEDFRPEVRFRQKLLSGPDAEAQADLALAISVLGQDGSILTSRASGGQSLNYPAGGCAGGAMALGEATARAIRLALDRVSTQLAGNDRLRLMAGANAPSVAAVSPPRDITGDAFETKAP